MASRIAEWAAEAQGHPTADDPGLDPHLTFTGAILGLATIDLTRREIRDWDVATLKASLKDTLLKIGDGDLSGRWYVRDRPKTPPQSLADLRAQLRARQREDLDRALQTVGEPDGVSFLVFAWNTPVGPNLLVLGLERGADGQVSARPYEAARTDPEVLRLRAGPDAARLSDKSVVVFGVGAIGSYVTDLLARSGVGRITFFDNQRLRPGDVVRHAASGFFVGDKKVEAMVTSIWINARWTRAVPRDEAVWAPTALGTVADGTDVVIDAVGTASFTAQLSRVCADRQRPLVSVALYRRGDIGRVRLQSANSDIEIADRPDDARFPKIPPGPGESDASWEAGCAAPIAQAPPTSVVGIAASAARLVVDLLMGREAGDLDLVEIYQPLPEAPFDETGTRRFRGYDG